MKILFLADEESKMYWEYFKKEDFKGIDIIVSCGDLNPSYLSFLTTMVGVPLLYVHGNHDDKYNVKPPEAAYALRMRFTNMRVYGFLAWEAQTVINREKISILRRR